ncbi:MAG: ubiquinone/menaquinone biosynthesis methyltransferase [Candidatus Dormibacteraeota bacterium]|nr:ubiquinone/menaquinone biosynthesis methyltransferase [Candidatus Dormibacteraeota bacterium]
MAERDPVAVQAMFDRIAGRYDLNNSLLSAASDARWRRTTAKAARLGPQARVLDVACGSGKLAGALQRRAAEGLVVGLDFSANMLRVAARKQPSVSYLRGDGLNLPFADQVFDAVTVGFGLRNYADPLLGLREMRRVVKPGGRTLVLEFVRPPRGLIGALYRRYLRHVLIPVGGWISGERQAYSYLTDTVDTYRTPEELVELGRQAGWREVELKLLTFRTVGLLSGRA